MLSSVKGSDIFFSLASSNFYLKALLIPILYLENLVSWLSSLALSSVTVFWIAIDFLVWRVWSAVELFGEIVNDPIARNFFASIFLNIVNPDVLAWLSYLASYGVDSDWLVVVEFPFSGKKENLLLNICMMDDRLLPSTWGRALSKFKLAIELSSDTALNIDSL